MAGPDPDHVRTTEVIGSLCLASDLAMGFPLEHGLQGTIVAMRLADEFGVTEDVRRDTYYGCLLFYAGCTTDSETAAELFRPGALLTHFTPVTFGSPGELVAGIVRALADPGKPAPLRWLEGAVRLPGAAIGHRSHIVAMCEVAEMLSTQLGAPAGACSLFRDFTARWDGKGPQPAAGDAIPLPLRIAHVARDTMFQQLIGGTDHAMRVVRERAGRAFDPDIASLVTADLLHVDTDGTLWPALLAAEPRPHQTLEGPEIDDALAALGHFADLVSSYFVGHSQAASELAAAAAEQLGLPDSAVVEVSRAGTLVDLGRVAVETHVWNKPGRLTADEWERVRMHPHHTERVLSRSAFLSRLGAIAGGHHERLDGSGYHRGSAAPAIGREARILAAADAWVTRVEGRPHRPALTPAEAAVSLADEVAAGRLDADCVGAVLTAAGQPAVRLSRPAGLTEREAQVVVLLTRGRATKQVAHELGISPKTADRHVQNAYAKMGVSTRAAATLFAMQHGLTSWGELPMSQAPGGI